MELLKVLVMLLLITSEALATWGVTAGQGSYMGDQHLGVIYQSESLRHLTEISLRHTPGVLGNDITQANLRYIYSPLFSASGSFSTNWLGIGAMATRCLCEDVFFESPAAYPAANYYDQTAYRFGLVLASYFNWESLQVYWDWTLLDQMAIALSNNSNMAKKTQDYWAGGFGARFFFD